MLSKPHTPLLGVLLLTACASPAPDVHDAVAHSLANVGDIQILDSHTHPGGSTCGHYLQIDEWGRSPDPQAFVYHNGAANTRPSPDDLAVFCSDDPVPVIRERFGIELQGEQGRQTRRAIADLHTLATALEHYYQAQGNYPSTAQGLAALRERPATASVTRAYPEGGYLKELPLDPWGQPYHYEGPVWGGVKSPYQLWTEGADRAPGGSGGDADIRVELLPYLEHATGD
jgi:general secretion pathway protein G